MIVQVNRKNVMLIVTSVAVVVLMVILQAKYWQAINNSNNPIIKKNAVGEMDIVCQQDNKAKQGVVKKHIVKLGESIGIIAEKYDLDVASIIGANPGINELIYPGDEVVILPEKGVLHNVVRGETLWQIANTYGINVQKILTANGKKTNDIWENEKIIIPGARPLLLPLTARSNVSRMIWPTNGTITSEYGWRWGRLHAGIDIANDVGTQIHAVLRGRVLFAGWQSGYGKMIVLEHNNGYSTIYGHLLNYLVGPGDYVESGQLLGYMGNTGNSTGPHLHFEVRLDGVAKDPLMVLP